MGTIVHNVSVGDSAFGWEADCIHPGVSIKYPSEGGNRGLNILSCVGNEAIIMNGEAKIQLDLYLASLEDFLNK